MEPPVGRRFILGFGSSSLKRTIYVVERKRLVSHTEAKQTLRRAGYSEQRIEDVLRDIPDPIDTERDGELLFKHGLSAGILMDQMGGSP
jgi:hypothetical protein